MVHHTEWDRKVDQRGGYMQKDHDEMEEIIKEIAPVGKHYPAFKHGSAKYDSHCSPSFYHRGYQSSHSMISVLKVFLFIILTCITLKFFMMASKPMGKRSSRSKSRSMSR